MSVLAQPPQNQSGVPYVDTGGVLPTYSATSNFVPASGVLAWISGSASKVILIRKVLVGGTASGQPGSLIINFQATSTQPSGGTGTAFVPVPHDSNFPASTLAAGSYYTAAPTNGTVTGTINSFQMGFPAQGSATIVGGPAVFAPALDQSPFVLRGANQCFVLQTNSTALAGGQIQITFFWNEVSEYP